MKTMRPEVIQKAFNRQVLWENGGTWRKCAGSFDGMGMSLGSIQFIAGGDYPTLQPILREVPVDLFVKHFGNDRTNQIINALQTNHGFFELAKNLNVWGESWPGVPGWQIEPSWKQQFEELANDPIYLKIEWPHVVNFLNAAERMASGFQSLNPQGERVDTDRGFDCFFDSACHNGERQPWVWIHDNEKTFIGKMSAFIDVLVSQSDGQWQDAVRSRKMAIVLPEGGWVQGSYYKGVYDDMPMYQEDYDMANATQNTDDSPSPNNNYQPPDINFPPIDNPIDIENPPNNNLPFNDIPDGTWQGFINDLQWFKENQLIFGDGQGNIGNGDWERKDYDLFFKILTILKRVIDKNMI